MFYYRDCDSIKYFNALILTNQISAVLHSMKTNE